MRVLFVDDDPRLLAGLRRSLPRFAETWTTVFVDNAVEAMTLLSNDTFDVVVTDLAMPGINGVQLLEYVASAAPTAGRVVFSGDSNSVLSHAALPLAHVMLAKPAHPLQIVDAVTQARR